MFKKFIGSFPSTLPATRDDFNKFCADIFNTYGFPDKPGYRQMVASMVMHMSETTTAVSKRYFSKAIKKAQANEVAYWVIQDCKIEIDAEEKRKKEELEATTPVQADQHPLG